MDEAFATLLQRVLVRHPAGRGACRPRGRCRLSRTETRSILL